MKLIKQLICGTTCLLCLSLITIKAPGQPAAGKAEKLPLKSSCFIAAADAPETVKLQADFVCPGSNDHFTINQALDNLPENGGHIRLSAGTYSIGAVSNTFGGICILRNNVLLTGEGAGTRLILQDGLSDVNVIWIKGKISNVSVRDLFIDGNGSNHERTRKLGWQGCNGIKAIDINPFDNHPSNISVQNCRIENCRLMAVMLSGENVEVLNSYFTGNFGSHVIEILGDSGRIDGCTLRVKEGERVGFGFSTDASFRYHITNNQIFVDEGGTIASHPINNWPLMIYGNKTNEYHGIISGNMLINRGKTGAVLCQGYMDLISNNIFNNVPVIIGTSPYSRGKSSELHGTAGASFTGNMLIDTYLELASPNRGDYCRILVDGNQFFNSTVKHTDGNVVFGLNPGYTPDQTE